MNNQRLFFPLLIGFILFTFSCNPQNQKAVKKITFPDSFSIESIGKSSQMIFRPLDERGKAQGFSGNPGYIDLNFAYKGLFSGLFPTLKQDDLVKVYTEIYIPNAESTKELGIVIAQLKSKEIADTLTKLGGSESGLWIAKTQQYLLFAFHDANGYPEEMKKIEAFYTKQFKDLFVFDIPED